MTIYTNTPNVTSIFALVAEALPERWRSESFIAGGYAADPKLACDVDVWVSVPVENNMDVVREEILQHLRERDYFRFEELSDVRVENELVDAYTNLQTRKVAIVRGSQTLSYTRPIHIIVTNGTVHDVLASFDLSVCQVAITFPNVAGPTVAKIVHGRNWTPTDESIIVLKDTPTTMARLMKYQARFVHLQAARLQRLATEQGLL